jgi:hypothetical protein
VGEKSRVVWKRNGRQPDSVVVGKIWADLQDSSIEVGLIYRI